MDNFKRRWKNIPQPIRKPLVFMVGFAVVVAGVAMLVLPGPGWAAIFLGFAILATEFAFAEKVRDQLTRWLKHLVALAKRHWRNILRTLKR